MKDNHSNWMNMFLLQGAQNENYESLYKAKSAQLGLVRVSTHEPKKIVRRSVGHSISLAAQYRFAIAFPGSLSDSFSSAWRVHFSRQANKERRSRRCKACDLESLVRWPPHDLLPLVRRALSLRRSTVSCHKRLALRRKWLPWNFPVSPSKAFHGG